MAEPEPPPEPERAAMEGAAESVTSGVPGSATPRRAALDAAGMERPAFLLDYPEDPALERLIAAFEAGNYALVRREAEGVAQNATDPLVRAAALELRARIEPDPLARYLLMASVLLLVLLTLWAYRAAAQ